MMLSQRGSMYVLIDLIVICCSIIQLTAEPQNRQAGVENINKFTKIKCNSKADIVFLVDSSSSVGQEDFQKVLSFIVNLLEDADIDRDHDIRIGLLTFSTDITIHFYLGQHKRKTQLINETINVPYDQGSTNTADALLAMRTEVFNTKNGDRKRIPNVAVVITDGISNLNSDRTVTEAIRAHSAGIHVFAIGIGFTGRTPELRLMVTSPVEENLFLVETFEELAHIRKAMFSRICEMSILKSASKPLKQPTPKGNDERATCEHAFDVAFIVNTRKADNHHIRSFLKRLSLSLDTETNLAEIAVVSGPTPQDIVPFNQHITKKQLLLHFENDNSIDRNDIQGQLSLLLRHAKNHVFTYDKGDREDIPNIAVVVADDIKPASLKDIRRQARKLKTLGIHVILLSTGYRGRRKSLNSITSKPYTDNKIMIRDVRKLQVIAKSLARHICSVARKKLLATTHSDYIKDREVEEEIEHQQEYENQWNFTQIPESCLGIADIVFVLDSSGSVGSRNFKLQLDFIKNFSSYLNIQPGGHRISVMSFSDNEKVHIWLNETHNYQSLVAAVDKVKYHYGSTNVASALRRIHTDMFHTVRHPEQKVTREKIVIIITDGTCNFRNVDPVMESRYLKRNAVNIISIAVNLRNTAELEKISSEPSSMFVHKAHTFRQLHGLIPVLVPPLCHGEDFCRSSPCTSDGICVNLMNTYKCECMKGYTGINCQLKCTRPTDLVFLMDSSASIGEENFEHIKSLAKGIVSHLNKYSCDYHIAAMKYGSTAIPQFYFHDYHNLLPLTSALDGISFSYGYTNTAEAIRVARKTFFTKERGDRSDVRDIMVVITDGLDNIRPMKLFQEAQITNSEDIAIIPIGVDIKNKTDITSLASSSNGLFFVEKFEQLENLTESFVDYMVKSEDMCSHRPCKNGGRCVQKATSYSCICSFGWNGQHCQSSCAPQVSLLFAFDTSGHNTWVRLYKMGEIFESLHTSIQIIDIQTPIALASLNSNMRIEVGLSKNITSPLATEMFNHIQLVGGDAIDVDIVSKLENVFKGEDIRDKTIIIMASNDTVSQLPLHNIVSSGIDVINLVIDDTDTVTMQFTPKFPYNDLHEDVIMKTNEVAEQVITLLCDSSNECSSRPCGKRGHCVDGRKSFSCICFEGYTGDRCERGCPVQADVAFLLDSSGSVGRRNFLKVQQFVSQIVSELSIGNNGSKVSVSTFSTRAKVWFYLDEYLTKESVIQAVMNTRYHYGDTNTADGLEKLREQVFTPRHGDRPDKQNVAIIVTDGLSNVRSYVTLYEAEISKDAGIHIFTVGVGLYDTSEITAMASYPNHQNTFVLADFDHLSDVVENLVSAICEDADICENNPCENDGKCVDHVNAFTCLCASGFSGPLCQTNCLTEMDLVYIIDTSTSVGETNFQRSLDFVKTITSYLEVDHGKARVALITFSDYVSVWINLDTFKKKSELLDAIDGVGYTNGAVFTSEALRVMRKDVFSASQGNRPKVSNKCILITDGVSNILPQKTSEEAIKLHHSGIQCITIGIGLKDAHELQQIAHNKEHVFVIDTYKQLNTTVKPVVDIICNSSPRETLPLVQYTSNGEEDDVSAPSSIIPLDVAFVIDSSGSVGNYNFSKILSFIEYFIELIYSRDMHYAVLTCSKPMKEYFYLQDNFPQRQLRKYVMNIPYIPGQLDLPSALNRLNTVVFSTRLGDRVNATNIGILILDGFTNDLRSSVRYAKQCREEGIVLYIVTVAVSDISVYIQLTGSSEQVIQVSTYGDLLNAAHTLFNKFSIYYSNV